MAHVPRRVTRAAKAAAKRVGSVYSVSAVAALECHRSAWTGLAGHCHWCNAELEGKRTAWCSQACHEAFELNHIFGEARQVILHKAGRVCEREDCTVRRDLQVNHIDPVVGQGYHPSCYHHLDNLEALCRPHHQIETNAQRAHRVTHWTEDSLTSTLVLPDPALPAKLRGDLIRRMLDRQSGFPFILPGEDFETSGQFHRYRPNTKWKTVLADLQQNFPKARVWNSEEQMWVPLTYFNTESHRCTGLKADGARCERLTLTPTCWQHSKRKKRAASPR